MDFEQKDVRLLILVSSLSPFYHTRSRASPFFEAVQRPEMLCRCALGLVDLADLD